MSRLARLVMVLPLAGLGACGDDVEGNQPPVVEEGLTAVMDEDSDFTFDLMAHVTDPDGDPLQLTRLTSADSLSSVAVAPDGKVHVQAISNYHGPLEIAFEVTDQHTPVAGTLSITVRPVNDVPSATTSLVVTTRNAARAFRLEGHDEDRDALTFVIVEPPAHGTLTGTPPDVEFTPAADFVGDDSFRYRVSDGTASVTATATLRVLPPT